MRRLFGYLGLISCVMVFAAACNKLPVFGPLPPTPTPTPTPGSIPTSTPGCYEASSLPVSQYTYPNPTPVMTPFGTPIPLVTSTLSGGMYVIDNQPHNAALLQSSSDWSAYWGDLGLPAPPAPVDFSSMMVFVPGTYMLGRICYTGTNVVVYQGSAGGGAQLCTSCIQPPPVIAFGTVTPTTPTATPTATPTPATLPQNIYLVPASNKPVSYYSEFLNAS